MITVTLAENLGGNVDSLGLLIDGPDQSPDSYAAEIARAYCTGT